MATRAFGNLFPAVFTPAAYQFLRLPLWDTVISGVGQPFLPSADVENVEIIPRGNAVGHLFPAVLTCTLDASQFLRLPDVGYSDSWGGLLTISAIS